MKKDLTQGNLLKSIAVFSVPYLLSYFLQTLYGLADLYIVGEFNDIDSITGVSIGSQIMHMITLIIVGLAMGSTITISRAVGAKDNKSINKAIANTIVLFGIISIIVTGVLLLLIDPIISVMSTPLKAVEETKSYLIVCFLGIPFIVGYNIISSILRGLGDSKTPTYFVGLACALNIGIDILLIGRYDLKSSGAAYATVIAQAISVIVAVIYVLAKKANTGLKKNDFKLHKPTVKNILTVGIPICLQDGFIQVAFLIITIYVNRISLEAASAVGIVEKLIGMLFLIPSAMGATVSAICSQCLGANMYKRARQALKYNIIIVVIFGLFVGILFQFVSDDIMAIFKDNESVIRLGSQYLSTYIFDCLFAGIHFCFSGYFCSQNKSYISFIHNLISIILIRIPGAIWATTVHSNNLTYLGLCSTLGSVISVIICVAIYFYNRKKFTTVTNEKRV